jgi:probable phosphoglycerate mutase
LFEKKERRKGNFSDMRRIYLARHGQVAPEGVLVGQADWPLTEAGRAEILAIKEKELTGVTFDLAFVSPLTRAKETLAILLGDANVLVQIEPDLREITLGEWDGLTKDEVKKRWPFEWKWRGEDFWERKAPGGESFRDLAERVWPAFDRIKEKAGQNTLVVAHQAVNRVILARERDIPVTEIFKIDQPTGAINVIGLP